MVGPLLAEERLHDAPPTPRHDDLLADHDAGQVSRDPSALSGSNVLDQRGSMVTYHRPSMTDGPGDSGQVVREWCGSGAT